MCTCISLSLCVCAPYVHVLHVGVCVQRSCVYFVCVCVCVLLLCVFVCVHCACVGVECVSQPSLTVSVAWPWAVIEGDMVSECVG